MNIDWSKIGNLVAGVAPTIAGALAGPFGPIASIAVTSLMRAVGLGSDATQDDLQSALLSGKPELLVQLRQAEQDFQIKLKDADVKIEEINQRDRDSARQREISVKDRAPAALAFLVCSGFFGLLAIMAFHALPAANETALNIMLGSLGTAFGAVVFYYFGSSSGSALKTAAFADVAKAAVTK